MDQSVIKKRVGLIVILSMIVLFCLLVGVIFQIIKINQLQKQKAQQEKYLNRLDSEIASLTNYDLDYDEIDMVLTYKI